MSKIKMISAVAILGFLIGCSPGQKVAFTGTWAQEQYQNEDAPLFESKIKVISDRIKFRIDATSINNRNQDVTDITQIYDGEFVHTHAKIRSETARSTEPYKAKVVATEPQLENLRFWLRTPVPDEVSEPGPPILGHETILYKAVQRRPGSRFESEQYVDKKTGILLRNVITLYNEKEGTMLAKGLYECIEIKYGTVKKSALIAEFGGT